MRFVHLVRFFFFFFVLICSREMFVLSRGKERERKPREDRGSASRLASSPHNWGLLWYERRLSVIQFVVSRGVPNKEVEEKVEC